MSVFIKNILGGGGGGGEEEAEVVPYPDIFSMEKGKFQ